MKTFWETLLLNSTKICAIIIALIVVLWWLSVPSDDFDDDEEDPFSVTITYHCKEVLLDPDDEPEDVVSECKKLAKELQNASKPVKPSV